MNDMFESNRDEVCVGERVHLINPSALSFGVAVITPRWLYVLAAATGTEWGDPCLGGRDA
jgi:hypothetical protein